MADGSKGETGWEELRARMLDQAACRSGPDPDERIDEVASNAVARAPGVFELWAPRASGSALGGRGDVPRRTFSTAVPVEFAGWQFVLGPGLPAQDKGCVNHDWQNCGTPMCSALGAARDPYERLLGEVAEQVDRRVQREVHDGFVGGFARLLVVGGVVLVGTLAWSALESWLGCRCG